MDAATWMRHSRPDVTELDQNSMISVNLTVERSMTRLS